MGRGWAREGQLCGEEKLSEPQKLLNHITVEHTQDLARSGSGEYLYQKRACRVYETRSTRLERFGAWFVLAADVIRCGEPWRRREMGIGARSFEARGSVQQHMHACSTCLQLLLRRLWYAARRDDIR